jgi:hypothetical protein
MNTLLLVLLTTCAPGTEPPGSVSPEPGAAQAAPSHHGHCGFFHWLRGHAHHKRQGSSNPHADGNNPAPVETQAVGTEPASPVVDTAPPALVPVATAPAPPGDSVPRQMPRGEPIPASAGPPGN